MAEKKQKVGSTEDAAAQASISATEAQSRQRWEPGKYILLTDKFQPVQGGLEYSKGDVVEVSKESEASRLGNAGALTPEGSLQAQRAQAKTPEDARAVRAAELRAEADRLEE